MKKNKILIIDLEYCFENANTMIVERITNLLRMKYDVDVATYDIGRTNRLKNREADVIKIPYYSLRKSRNTVNLGVNRKAAYFVRIAGFENPPYMEFFKKMRNFRGKEFTRLMILCYNIHGISPPFML